MKEYLKHDEWKIIELNPRLWGSVMLSEFCGARLLSTYLKVIADEKPDLPSLFGMAIIAISLLSLNYANRKAQKVKPAIK